MATKIWDAAAVTPLVTDRFPVDVGASGAPSRWTGQQIADASGFLGKTHNALGSISTATAINLANGTYVSATIAGNLPFTITNPPASPNGCEFTLVLTNGGAYTITWPGSISWAGGTAPTLTASGVNVLHFATGNGGTNWYGWTEADEVYSPGGSTTQLQYNNAGSFGGMSGTAWDDTNRSLVLTGATVTANKPIFDLSQTWNNAAVAFTGVKVNVTPTASAIDSSLLDLQTSGASRLIVLASGGTASVGPVVAISAGKLNCPAISFAASGAADTVFGATGLYYTAQGFVTFGGASTEHCGLGILGLGLTSSKSVTWSSGSTVTNGPDLYLSRDAAGTLAQRNGTAAQTSRIYGTYTDASNYERLSIKASPAANWMQIAAETAGTGGDNLNIALTPTGTGAISAHVPDSAAAGGNARGANSVDFGTYRTAAARVASGQYSVVIGGNDNGATAAGAAAIGGFNLQATGANSVALGESSTASGVATMAFGSGATASGTYAITLGRNATASGVTAVALGHTTTASGDYSLATGLQSTTRGLIGAYAHSSGMRSAQGDAQVIGQPVRCTTAAVTTVQLSADGAAPTAATVMVLPNNSGGQFEARVSAYQSTGCGGWKIEGTGYRGANAAATVIQGATTITAFGIVAGIGAPTVDVVADTTLGALVIQITPANTTSTYWVGKLELIQVA